MGWEEMRLLPKVQILPLLKNRGRRSKARAIWCLKLANGIASPSGTHGLPQHWEQQQAPRPAADTKSNQPQQTQPPLH